ncbi:hypothetical protein MBLNU459_g4489t1 [Dothideomycetes sp. NU459]
MAPSRKARKLTKSIEPVLAKTSPSSELGEGNVVDYNSRTGRPIRKSAGRKSLITNYVDPDEVISDLEDDEDIFLDSVDDTVRVAPKRRRSPSPPTTPRVRYADDMMSISSTPEHVTAPVSVPALSFTFHVPPGHTGPFVVNFDLNSLISSHTALGSLLTSEQSRTRLSTDSGFSSKGSEASERSKSIGNGKAGFLSLPAELRNQVYRLAFVTREKLNFGSPRNFARSSALLRTCRQVHEEGRSILYSENTFYLQRRAERRNPTWSSESYEIGYKDARFFMKEIGPANLGLLRHLIIVFADAIPSLNPHFKGADDRRFTNDNDLLYLLRLLGDRCTLKTLDLSFQGKKMLFKRDETRFFFYLTRIKADKVNTIGHPDYPNWPSTIKLDRSDEKAIVREMTRVRPLFNQESKR